MGQEIVVDGHLYSADVLEARSRFYLDAPIRAINDAYLEYQQFLEGAGGMVTFELFEAFLAREVTEQKQLLEQRFKKQAPDFLMILNQKLDEHIEKAKEKFIA